MKDRFGRNMEYLRISLTDKCNLRCKYCMPQEGVTLMPHAQMLTLEEIARLTGIFAKLGIKKVRLTGGEPLVRKNMIKLVQDIHGIAGIEEICMTTNGILFADQVEELKKAGLTHVNISLDTLDANRFRMITGYDGVEKVLQAIEKALQCGMRVKINCVPCEELNREDLCEVAGLARKYPVDVRFIELMPIGCGKSYHGIAADEVIRILESQYGECVPDERVDAGSGPANYMSFADFKGRIGTISPMSHKFCNRCNRIRLTAEGKLKLCLHYETGADLKKLLRTQLTDSQIQTQIEAMIFNKPKEHDFIQMEEESIDQRKMHQIGG